MTRQERRLVVAGTMLIGVSYGLARFAYGLFLPSMREDVGMSSAMAGAIGSGAYLGYCLAIVVSALLVERLGARRVAVIAALIAAVGMAAISVSTSAPWLAGAILLAGASTGLASPPMAQAVSVTIVNVHQGRANTVINAGTSLGVAISGPVAFAATGQWRIAYAAFAVAALVNALLLSISVPRADAGDRRSDPLKKGRGAGIWRSHVAVLVLAAVGMGMASAAYWTFSSEAVVTLGHFDQATANIVWILIGVAGLAGGLAGDLVKRLGLDVVHRGALAALALSLCLLAMLPFSLPALLVSAALFGGAYIMLTGVYLVWGIRLYADRPAIGLGLPFLMIAVGQIVGSPLAGYLIGGQGYAFCFIAFALIAVTTMLAGYRADGQKRADTRPPVALKGMPVSSRPPIPPFYMPAMPPLGLIDKIGRKLNARLGAGTDRR
ncbi:YbfB/YjiJ family MFS transporter [Salinicola corii]|uniref:YbfB/YjiJ family MFS transporter n=1 Tax=Salinicola corii TaxID=2606937 RepID=A0A640WH22_9GAMM|nr:MFS transporter [Salinicola corii]KAA0019685.1 YbfB/YjiJ family MFS transporter [Salinicola corii]